MYRFAIYALRFSASLIWASFHLFSYELNLEVKPFLKMILKAPLDSKMPNFYGTELYLT